MGKRARAMASVVVSLLLGVAVAAAPAAANPAKAGQPASGNSGAYQYEIVNLGSLGGPYGEAFALNDRGHVVGYSVTAGGSMHPFLWRDGTMIDLGVLDESVPYGVAGAVNNLDEVVGASDVSGGTAMRAFLWRRGAMIDLGTLGGTYSVATGINDRSQVVGYSNTADNIWHAFLWEKSKMVDLGLINASAINNRGEIVGGSGFGQGYHAYVWRRGSVTDLGVTGGDYSQAAAINDNGSIVGNSAGQLSTTGFLWRTGVMRALPGFGYGTYSEARAINDREQILGVATDGSGSMHNVLWKHGELVDLAPSGLPVGYDRGGAIVRDINDQGQIVGAYYFTDGQPGAALFR